MAVLLLANKVISNSSGILICMYIFATVESLIRLIFNSVTSRYIRAITLKVERSRRFDRTSFGSTVSPPGWIKRAKWQAVGWKGRYIANRRWDAEAESCMKAKKRDSIDRSADCRLVVLVPLWLFLVHLKAAKGSLNYATRSKGASNLFPAT